MEVSSKFHDLAALTNEEKASLLPIEYEATAGSRTLWGRDKSFASARRRATISPTEEQSGHFIVYDILL
jgi:hypothetical protein